MLRLTVNNIGTNRELDQIPYRLCITLQLAVYSSNARCAKPRVDYLIDILFQINSENF